MEVPSTEKWHSKSIEETAKKLNTDPRQGLSYAEAAARSEQYGYNELREQPRPGFWRRLLNQLNEFLVLILIASAIVSFFIGVSEYRRTGAMTEFVDSGAIMAIVVLNAILGVVQEGRAEESLAALKKMAAPNAMVLRDGHQFTIPARELVPGDVVILETGNYVPADVRLIESVNLRVEEASLTGESVPVSKHADEVVSQDAVLGDRHNCGYMSTIVTYGRGQGIVVATGMQTEIGKIAEMIQSSEQELTPLQVKLDQLGKWLGVGCLIVCGIVGVVGVARDPSLSVLFQSGLLSYFGAARETLLEMFMIAVSLAIAAVPEGLPAVVTICLAIGMQEMVKSHALIRRLPAVETLGSATAICSDKTGTLTQNEMTAVQLYVDRTLLNITGGGYNPQGDFQADGQPVDLAGYPGSRLLLRAGLLCNDARLERMDGDEADDREWRMVGDPTEGAFVVAAAKAGLWKDELRETYPRLAEIPFDSARKRMTTIHPDPRYGDYVAYVKGAPDVILGLCEKVIEDGVERPLTDERRNYILDVNKALASNALRVLGVA
ncbi:MAG: HAD-IC family P-type ATPase, partial [Chloroflexota bacterium]|nr:HAD-IC family P-type ATPase [Chloroflexota bacterium]